jgi:sec-independent protein translocase protein TatA
MVMPTPIFAAFLGGQELWLILVIVLLLFGGSKLPSLARGLGQSIKEFKKASNPEQPDAKDAEAKPADPKKSETPPAPGPN